MFKIIDNVIWKKGLKIRNRGISVFVIIFWCGFFFMVGEEREVLDIFNEVRCLEVVE